MDVYKERKEGRIPFWLHGSDGQETTRLVSALLSEKDKFLSATYEELLLLLDPFTYKKGAN